MFLSSRFSLSPLDSFKKPVPVSSCFCFPRNTSIQCSYFPRNISKHPPTCSGPTNLATPHPRRLLSGSTRISWCRSITRNRRTRCGLKKQKQIERQAIRDLDGYAFNLSLTLYMLMSTEDDGSNVSNIIYSEFFYLKFSLPCLDSAWIMQAKWVQTSQLLDQWFLR